MKKTTPYNKVGFYSVNAKLVYHSKINVSYHIEQIKKKKCYYLSKYRKSIKIQNPFIIQTKNN